MKCGCSYCCTCLNEMIITATEGNIVQNVFERNRKKKIRCSCGGGFDAAEALRLLGEENESNENYASAKKRLNKYALSYCLKCCRAYNDEGDSSNVDVTVDSMGKGKSKLYASIKILSSEVDKEMKEGIDYTECNHIICMKCIRKEELKEEEESADIKIKCSVCGVVHHIDKNEWGSKVKKSCCPACMIY